MQVLNFFGEPQLGIVAVVLSIVPQLVRFRLEKKLVFQMVPGRAFGGRFARGVL